MVTSISTLVLVAYFVGYVIFVMGDFSCLCSYSVEVPVHTTTEESSAAIGYLYEFDCKPVSMPLIDSKWIPIEFSHQVGYVLQSAEQMVQTCPGNPSLEDIVTTTTTKTMPNISTSMSSTANNSLSSSKSTDSHSFRPTTRKTMSNSSSASISTTTTASTITESTTSQPSHANTTTEVLQSRTPTVNATYTITSLPYSTMTQTTTHGNITETKPFMLSTNTYHSRIQETTSSTEAAASKEMTSKFETKTTASILYGTSNVPSKAAEPKSNNETTPSINNPETVTITSTTATFGALSTPSANTDTTDPFTDYAFTIGTITTNTTSSSATDAKNVITIVAIDKPSTASISITFPTTAAIPTIETSTEAKTTQTQIPRGCSDAVKIHAETYHGATVFQGSTCLELVTYPMDWESAETTCASRGGHLVDILSQRDEDMVISFLHSNHVTGNVWIGLNDRNREGTFVWSSGHPLTYKNWITEVSVTHFLDDCVVLVPDHTTLGFIHLIEKWNDIPCSWNNAFICRYEHKSYQEVIIG